MFSLLLQAYNLNETAERKLRALIPSGRLEDVQIEHLDKLLQTELFAMFVVRKYRVFDTLMFHQSINKGNLEKVIEIRKGRGPTTPQQEKDMKCLIVWLPPMLRGGDQPCLPKSDLKEADLPPIPKAGEKIQVKVEITTALPKKEYLREWLELADERYVRNIDANIDLDAIMEDVRMHVLIWEWRQRNCFEEIAKSPDVTDFERLNAGVDAVLGIAAGYLVTGERLRSADPLFTDLLRNPVEAKLELAADSRRGGAYAHYQHSGDYQGWIRGGKAIAIRTRNTQHANAALLKNIRLLGSPLYSLCPRREAICRSALAPTIFEEDLSVHPLYEMTEEGEKRAHELHYFTRGIVAFLMESRRDLSFEEKNVTTSQYHSESFAQHCIAPFGSLNRSGGYEAFGHYRSAFPVGLSAEATREARLEKDRERERKRHQEMKANPEKYAAKVEKQRERYQEKKANEPEKHAAKLEKRREGYDAEKRRKRYQVAAAAKARSKRSSVAASSASAAVVAASSQNGTGDEGSTMEIEDLLHRTFLPVPGQIGFAARMARMYLDASTDVVAEDLLRRTSLPVPGQIGFAARMAETYLRSKKKKKRAPESPAPKKRQRVNCSPTPSLKHIRRSTLSCRG